MNSIIALEKAQLIEFRKNKQIKLNCHIYATENTASCLETGYGKDCTDLVLSNAFEQGKKTLKKIKIRGVDKYWFSNASNLILNNETKTSLPEQRIYNTNGTVDSFYIDPDTRAKEFLTTTFDDDEAIKIFILKQPKGGKLLVKPVKTDRFVTLPNGHVYRLYGSARNWWVLRRGEGFVRVRPVRL